MANFCGKCGQRVDAKTGLCLQCDKAILIKKKKRKKSLRAVVAVLCCISIIAVGVFGILKFFNKDTVPNNPILSPESAVDIYMANKNVWMENPEYTPMQGYAYCLLDLDFDGVLELINSTNDGSGRYSYNKFYKINLDKLTVEEFYPQSEQSNGGIDYYYMAHTSKLLKNKSTTDLFYLFEDYYRVNDEDVGETFVEIYMKDDILYENSLFSEYWYSDYDNNSNEIKVYTFKGNEVSKSEYKQKTEKFYEENTDLNLVWKYISGNEFDEGTDSTQKQLLLDAYCSYSYDGFSFDDVETYNITLTDFEEPQSKIENEKQYAMVDYYGMTVNDIVDIWGSDYTVTDYLIGGGWGGIYYEDKRCPFIFCFESTSMPPNCDGNEQLSGIIGYPEKQDSDFSVIDDIKLVCTMTEVSEKISGTFYEDELLDGQTYHCKLDNGIILNFTWQDDVNLPIKISVTFIR